MNLQKISEFLSRFRWHIIITLLGISVLLIFFALRKFTPIRRASDSDAEQYVISEIDHCYKNGNQGACYRAAAADFARRFEPRVVLTVIAKNEKRPEIFQVCHETLHYFGREVYDRIKNTSKALSQGDATCFAGYYHGVLEGYFIEKHIIPGGSISSLAKEIPSICGQDKTQTRKDYHECLHGLGHALMFATDSALPYALKLCDTIPQAETSWCYGGVFMENSTSSTNKDHPSKYLKKDDPTYPCSILDDKYLPMCYTSQTLYVIEKSNQDWGKVFNFCKNIPGAYRKDCYMAVGDNLAGYSQDPYMLTNDTLSEYILTIYGSETS